ncbi:hypothetical protein [Yinghuangia seranimata]|uniref:hypothetical protein n=1 Tax=Yinghuangia seranimata TaxID=408067 RepID=UPI00248B057B|nr:hypothetical protein [Yinghuangia seranimata]MDI2132834.1 hypothetical protein [Yinghuangia seranimata]
MDDAQYEREWEEFVARERAQAQRVDRLDQLAPVIPLRRRGPARNVLIAAAAVGTLLLGVGVYALAHVSTSGASDDGAKAAAASASTTAAPATTGAPAAAAPAGGTAKPTAPASPKIVVTVPEHSRPPGVDKAEKAAPISAATAFPDKKVTLPSGEVFQLVDVTTVPDCRGMMSPELADVVDQGHGCAQLLMGLFTDPTHSKQITVSVLSMRKADDAIMLFGMMSMDPFTYQLGAIDPPPGSGIPAPPRTAPGDFARVVSVRSLVASAWMWTDGRNTGEEELGKNGRDLLGVVSAKVDAYEEGTAR